MQQLLTKHKDDIEAIVTDLLQMQGEEAMGGVGGARDNVAGGSSAGSDATTHECVVCMDSKKSHALVPCGHMCVCKKCAETILATRQLCPVCRALVLQVFKVYL